MSDIHPCAMPIALMDSSDQQRPPTIDLSQLNCTGLHCGKIAAASSKLVIVLNAINAQKNQAHRLLDRLLKVFRLENIPKATETENRAPDQTRTTIVLRID